MIMEDTMTTSSSQLPDGPYQLTAEDKALGWNMRGDWGEHIGYWADTLLHDPPNGGPAFIDWYENGQPWKAIHFQQGQRHDPRDGGPAYRCWYESGQLRGEFYYQQGQLHNPDESTPAVRWWNSDGTLNWEMHYCREVAVGASFWSWTVEDALTCENTEQRRVWFEEHGGWENLEDRFHLIDEQPDPGNPGHTLRLCRFPNKLDPYDGDAQIVFCDNASLDLDGSRRRYGLIFPRDWGSDAVAVMAKSFGLTREQYQGISIAR
jgi:hypothetical protein